MLPTAPPPKSAEVEDSQSGAVDLHLELRMMPRATCGTAPLMADSARVDDPVLHQAAGVPKSPPLQLHQTLRSAVVGCG